MSAIINQRATSSSTLGENAKPELVQKVEGQVGRITGIYLMAGEDEGFLSINEDKTLRVMLKRESGQFWPSTIQDLPSFPTKLICDETYNCIFVGLVNGVVYEYEFESDFNSISFKRQWMSHTSAISGLAFSGPSQQIISCSKDKTIVWHNTDTTQKIGSYVLNSPCTTMQFDDDSKFVFVGDYSGNIFVLRLLANNSTQLISKLSAHTGSISDLSWDARHQNLYSASSDSLVIIWDIGGKRGNCYELNGHSSKLTKLALAPESRRLFSADECGHMMCWDMRANRVVAPAWGDSDKCEICDVPFFWNVKVMWDRKVASYIIPLRKKFINKISE